MTSRIIIFLCLLLLSLGPCGVSSSAQDNDIEATRASVFFQSGMEAFKRGAFEPALQSFLQAEAAGMAKPALYYNIGVCSYKMGQYDQAEKAFQQTAEFPDMSPLAYYNLGLISLKLSDTQNALSWFNRAYAEADDEKLRIMAAAALDFLRKDEKKDIWLKFGSLGLGYDDNAALVSQTETLQNSGQDDFFIEALGHLSRSFTGQSAGSAIQLNMNAYVMEYFELDDYDVATVGMNLRYKKKTDSLQITAGGEYWITGLGNELFEQTPGLILQVQCPLAVIKASGRFRYRAGYIDILDSDYEYLEGWRHQALAESSWKRSAYRAVFAYVLEVNDRDEHDYSPTRHSVMGALHIQPSEKIKISLGCSFRRSNYDIRGGSDREEDRFRADLGLTLYMKKGWEIKGEYQYTNNVSTYDYDYSRNMVTFSIGKIF